MAVDKRLQLRKRRKARIRKKIYGTAERPRLTVFRSPRHIYAQVIDDLTGKTLAQVSSFEKGARANRANLEKCGELGKKLAERCREHKIEKVVFDKNGYDYHGRVKALADGVREAGIEF